MSKKTLYILGIILTAIIGAILQFFLCCNCCSSKKIEETAPVVTPVPKPEAPVKLEATKNALAFIDPESDFKFRSNDNFNFNESNFAILTPISTDVEKGVDTLSSYFKANNTKVVSVIGLYKSSEENTSAFTNLGIARANAVKNYLVSKGISSKQINLGSKLNDNLIPENNIYYGPIAYEIATDKVDHTEELNALKAEILANPLILYFQTNSNNINLSDEQRLKMQKISSYVDKVDNAKVSVVGHTDSQGNVNNNIKLGLSRANTIKDYLLRNGINENDIEVSSEGPKKPIAPNNTAAGMAKNRRVEVTIK